jgi:hypothetical protein
MTSAQWLVIAVLGHVLLTAVVGVLTLRARIAAVKAGKARLQVVALNNAGWPEEARKLANNFDNQFQVPVLVYVVSTLFVATGLADMNAAGLAFAFLAARVLHTFEHTGRNTVLKRLTYFLASYAFALAMWVWFAIRFLMAG